jgi:Rab-like protein 3
MPIFLISMKDGVGTNFYRYVFYSLLLGVGKTSAVHMICNSTPLLNPSWTVGCALEVKLHDYRAGSPEQKSYFVDLWDIGGSASHGNSRRVFYNGVNGIILVHDLTNRKSEANLHKWIMEILNRDSSGGTKFNEEEDFDPEILVGSGNVAPILVMGTKMDAIEGRRQMSSRSSSIAEECRADEVLVVRTHSIEYVIYTIDLTFEVTSHPGIPSCFLRGSIPELRTENPNFRPTYFVIARIFILSIITKVIQFICV